MGELSLTMLDYINYIMEDYEYDFKHDYSHYEEIFTKLHHMIVLLTRYNTSEEFLLNIFNTLRLFVHKFRTIIFRNQKSSFCIDFCSELLQKCFETAQTLMNVAASILYYIIKQNYTEMGQFLRCKLAFTVAISKLDQKHYPQSLHLFDTFLSYARENDASITNWELNMRDIMSRLYRIASYSSKISTIKDPELKCEVYRNLSVESNNSLEQQVKWLSKLAIVHQELNNFEEAGLAKVLIAAYIADYLTKSRKDELYYLPQNLSYFKTVAPNIVYDLPLRDDCISEPVSSVTFHDSGYIDIITSAIDEMVKANVFEEAVELLASLFQLHKATGNFKKLAGVGRLLQELAEKATKAIEGNLRMFNNYYRVAFYGSKFGELDNTKYIYKEHPSNRLVDFSARLVAQFSELLGVEVKAIPNKPLSELNLDPQGCYIQVISVEPYQDLERVKSKKEITTFDKQHGVDAYGFEAPYGGPDGGKPSDEVSKQWKKRNIYLIPKFFPALTRRLKVCDERQLPLGPLDCAIDLLDNRIELIKLELQLRPPNTKTLQIVLQGSIMLQVNAGPKAIMHYFLGNPGPWDKKKITLLKDKLLEFIRKCGFALRLNTKLIAEEQRAYQQAMEEHFEMFKSEARQYLDV
uniref:DOCKER domain-containing protein n=1 Tax=Arcella intermedia TaxID=1963864 RepID=A0A6B2KZP6_9EUKA